MSVAQRERAALVESLRAVGPDAPTLCEGWTARDLAAHLVVRERRVDAMPGILFPPLGSYTARVQQKIADTTKWPDLLDAIADGPPAFSPFKLLDSLINVNEMFIHTEDVRRAAAQWQPRDLDDDTAAALRRTLPLMAKVTLARMPERLTLRTPDGEAVTTVGRGRPVDVIAEPQDLLLFAAGRNAVRATFRGDDDAVAAVKTGRRGL